MKVGQEDKFKQNNIKNHAYKKKHLMMKEMAHKFWKYSYKWQVDDVDQRLPPAQNVG